MDTRPDWYLDELTHAGPEHLDAAYVATYDRKAQTDFSEDLALLRAQGLTEASTLIDLGAGTGGLALGAAAWCGRVVAVDVSPAMLTAPRGPTTSASPTSSASAPASSPTSTAARRPTPSTRATPSTTCRTSGKRSP
jgi:SAM-dependent methyltransferase